MVTSAETHLQGQLYGQWEREREALLHIAMRVCLELLCLKPPCASIRAYLPQSAGIMPEAGWTKLSSEELRLAKKWYFDDKKKPAEIADLLGRDKSTLTRALVKQVPRKKQGRPRVLSEADVDFLERRLDELIVKSMGKYHVTAALVRRSARCKASVKAIQLAFRKRRLFFFPQTARKASAHRGQCQGSLCLGREVPAQDTCLVAQGLRRSH